MEMRKYFPWLKSVVLKTNQDYKDEKMTHNNNNQVKKVHLQQTQWKSAPARQCLTKFLQNKSLCTSDLPYSLEVSNNLDFTIVNQTRKTHFVNTYVCIYILNIFLKHSKKIYGDPKAQIYIEK